MIGSLIAKSKVTSSYDALNNRDIKSFLAAWHDECVWCYPGAVSVSGEFKGKKAVEGWFQSFLDHVLFGLREGQNFGPPISFPKKYPATSVATTVATTSHITGGALWWM